MPRFDACRVHNFFRRPNRCICYSESSYIASLLWIRPHLAAGVLGCLTILVETAIRNQS